MVLANNKLLSKTNSELSVSEPKKNKNNQVMGNSELKSKKSFQDIPIP